MCIYDNLDITSKQFAGNGKCITNRSTFNRRSANLSRNTLDGEARTEHGFQIQGHGEVLTIVLILNALNRHNLVLVLASCLDGQADLQVLNILTVTDTVHKLMAAASQSTIIAQVIFIGRLVCMLTNGTQGTINAISIAVVIRITIYMLANRLGAIFIITLVILVSIHAYTQSQCTAVFTGSGLPGVQLIFIGCDGRCLGRLILSCEVVTAVFGSVTASGDSSTLPVFLVARHIAGRINCVGLNQLMAKRIHYLGIGMAALSIAPAVLAGVGQQACFRTGGLIIFIQVLTVVITMLGLLVLRISNGILLAAAIDTFCGLGTVLFTGSIIVIDIVLGIVDMLTGGRNGLSVHSGGSFAIFVLEDTTTAVTLADIVSMVTGIRTGGILCLNQLHIMLLCIHIVAYIAVVTARAIVSSITLLSTGGSSYNLTTLLGVVMIQRRNSLALCFITAVDAPSRQPAFCCTGCICTQRFYLLEVMVQLGMCFRIAGIGCIRITSIAFRSFRTSLQAGSVFVIYIVGEDVIQLRMCRVENRLGLGVTTIVTCCSLRAGLGAGCVFVVHIVGVLMVNGRQLQSISSNRSIVLCVCFGLEQLLTFAALKVCSNTGILTGGRLFCNESHLVIQTSQAFGILLLNESSIGRKGCGVSLFATGLASCVVAGNNHLNGFRFHVGSVVLTSSGSGTVGSTDNGLDFLLTVPEGVLDLVPIVAQSSNILRVGLSCQIQRGIEGSHIGHNTLVLTGGGHSLILFYLGGHHAVLGLIALGTLNGYRAGQRIVVSDIPNNRTIDNSPAMAVGRIAIDLLYLSLILSGMHTVRTLEHSGISGIASSGTGRIGFRNLAVSYFRVRGIAIIVGTLPGCGAGSIVGLIPDVGSGAPFMGTLSNGHGFGLSTEVFLLELCLIRNVTCRITSSADILGHLHLGSLGYRICTHGAGSSSNTFSVLDIPYEGIAIGCDRVAQGGENCPFGLVSTLANGAIHIGTLGTCAQAGFRTSCGHDRQLNQCGMLLAYARHNGSAAEFCLTNSTVENFLVNAGSYIQVFYFGALGSSMSTGDQATFTVCGIVRLPCSQSILIADGRLALVSQEARAAEVSSAFAVTLSTLGIFHAHIVCLNTGFGTILRILCYIHQVVAQSIDLALAIGVPLSGSSSITDLFGTVRVLEEQAADTIALVVILSSGCSTSCAITQALAVTLMILHRNHGAAGNNCLTNRALGTGFVTSFQAGGLRSGNRNLGMRQHWNLTLTQGVLPSTDILDLAGQFVFVSGGVIGLAVFAVVVSLGAVCVTLGIYLCGFLNFVSGAIDLTAAVFHSRGLPGFQIGDLIGQLLVGDLGSKVLLTYGAVVVLLHTVGGTGSRNLRLNLYRVAQSTDLTVAGFPGVQRDLSGASFVCVELVTAVLTLVVILPAVCVTGSSLAVNLRAHMRLHRNLGAASQNRATNRALNASLVTDLNTGRILQGNRYFGMFFQGQLAVAGFPGFQIIDLLGASFVRIVGRTVGAVPVSLGTVDGTGGSHFVRLSSFVVQSGNQTAVIGDESIHPGVQSHTGSLTQDQLGTTRIQVVHTAILTSVIIGNTCCSTACRRTILTLLAIVPQHGNNISFPSHITYGAVILCVAFFLTLGFNLNINRRAMRVGNEATAAFGQPGIQRSFITDQHIALVGIVLATHITEVICFVAVCFLSTVGIHLIFSYILAVCNRFFQYLAAAFHGTSNRISTGRSLSIRLVILIARLDSFLIDTTTGTGEGLITSRLAGRFFAFKNHAFVISSSTCRSMPEALSILVKACNASSFGVTFICIL